MRDTAYNECFWLKLPQQKTKWLIRRIKTIEWKSTLSNKNHKNNAPKERIIGAFVCLF